jgi:hypothetical protein
VLLGLAYDVSPALCGALSAALALGAALVLDRVRPASP